MLCDSQDDNYIKVEYTEKHFVKIGLLFQISPDLAISGNEDYFREKNYVSMTHPCRC